MQESLFQTLIIKIVYMYSRWKHKEGHVYKVEHYKRHRLSVHVPHDEVQTCSMFMFHKHAPERLWRKHRCARKEPKLCKLRVTEKEAKGTDKDRSERSICGTTWKHDYITSCSQQTCLLKWVWLTHIQDMFSSTRFVTSTYTLQSYSAKYSHSVLIPLLAASDRKVSEGNETIYTNYTVK